MKRYVNKGTPQTPDIDFDLGMGTLSIIGRSIPEDAKEFYKPLYEAIDTYLKTPQPNTILTLQLEYFNTTTSVFLLGIFRKFESLNTSGNKVIVNWNYEDEDMKESGEDYQKVVTLPIKLVSVTD